MLRHEKEQMVSTLNDVFSSAQVGLLVDYRGLTVEEATDLRRKLRDSASNMKVLKNRLAKRAVKDTPFAALEDNFIETRALVYADEPVGPAKVVSEFSKGNRKLQFITGLLVKGEAGQVVDEATVKALASLPSREELIAQFLGLLQGVPGKFVRTLNEVPSKFVRALAAVNESKGDAA